MKNFGKYILSSSLDVIVATQVVIWLVSAGGLYEKFEKSTALSPRGFCFAVTFGLYTVFSVLFAVIDKERKNLYSEADTSCDAKGTAIFYLVNYFLPDILASAASTFVLIIMSLFGVLTPVYSFVSMGFVPALILGIILLTITRMASFAISVLVWYLSENYTPSPVIVGIFNGILTTVFSIVLGFVLAVISSLAFEFVIMFGLKLEPKYEELAFDLLMHISFFAALPLGWGIAYRVNNSLREDFLMETEGLVPVNDGFKLHFRENKTRDIVCMVTVFALLVFLIFCTDIPFALSGISIYGGNLTAIIVGALVVLPCDLYAVYYAQKHWRAKYFLDIFGYESRRIV